MFIQTESTPNPATMRFIPGRTVLGPGKTAEFRSTQSAARSPLAARIFATGAARAVMLGSDFISVTKTDGVAWPHLKPQILGAIVEHFLSDDATMRDLPGDRHAENYAEADRAIVTRIKELLDAHVRPAVARDGGDITFHGYENGVVYLNMRGACAGCPSSAVTLKMGVETLLRRALPEVTEVQAIAL